MPRQRGFALSRNSEKADAWSLRPRSEQIVPKNRRVLFKGQDAISLLIIHLGTRCFCLKTWFTPLEDVR